MKDIWINIIESDFDVKLLAKNENACLFFGFRGALIHFITDSNGMIFQTHAPRFELAVGFEYLFEKEEVSPAYHKVSKSILLTDGDQSLFQIHVGKESFELMPEVHVEFFQAVNADIQRYLNACNAIDRGEFDEPMEKLRRPSGDQIIIKPHNIQILLQLLFEDSFTGEIDGEHSISLMELYDRLWDKKCNVSDKDFIKMAESIRNFSLVSDNEIVDVVDTMQFNVFGQESFSIKDNVPLESIVEIIKDGYLDLTLTQKVVFCSIVERYDVIVFFVFAYIAGEISLNEFIDYATKGYQPDSKEEQQLRMDITLIDYFNIQAKEGVSKYLGYTFKLPAINEIKARSYFYYDSCFLRAREKAIRQIINFNKEHGVYEGVILNLVLAMYFFSEEREPGKYTILTGERMHTPDILSTLDHEAAILKHQCGFYFPVMQSDYEGETYEAVNQFYSSLYYFTA